MQITKNVQLGGKTFSESRTIAAASEIATEKKPAAAKTGSLTTRTSDTVGELTMTVGHGITTGARLDIYWTENGVNGVRRGVVVGTVATNQVPFSGGAGDILPTAATAVKAMVPTLVEMRFDGDDIVALAVAADARAIFVFTTAAAPTVELASFVIDPAGTMQGWNSGSGSTNPLAGDVPERLYMSHGDSAAARTLKAAVGYN
jgi:hypothetical protein